MKSLLLVLPLLWMVGCASIGHKYGISQEDCESAVNLPVLTLGCMVSGLPTNEELEAGPESEDD